jgi:hypothetical protein
MRTAPLTFGFRIKWLAQAQASTGRGDAEGAGDNPLTPSPKSSLRHGTQEREDLFVETQQLRDEWVTHLTSLVQTPGSRRRQMSPRVTSNESKNTSNESKGYMVSHHSSRLGGSPTRSGQYALSNSGRPPSLIVKAVSFDFINARSASSIRESNLLGDFATDKTADEGIQKPCCCIVS